MSKKCPSTVTIYGLFPEDDNTDNTTCDGYARPECITGCFSGGGLYLPFGLTGIIPTCDWWWEFEIWTEMALTAVNIPLLSEEPYQGAGATPSNLRFTSPYWAIDRTQPGVNWAGTVGSTSIFAGPSPATPAFRKGWWTKFTYGCFGGSVKVKLYNPVQGGFELTGNYGFAAAGLIPTPEVVVGLVRTGAGPTEYLLDGYMQNIKLIENGVTLGDWPVTGQRQLGNIILDVSGNENHGYFLTGGWGDCP